MAYLLDKYRAEAGIDPFVLDVGDGKQVVIPVPTGEQLLNLTEIPLNQPTRWLRELLKDSHAEVLELVKNEPYPVLSALIADIAKHFKINMGSLPVGGSDASPS